MSTPPVPREPKQSQGGAAAAVATAQVDGPTAPKGGLVAAYGEPKAIEIMHIGYRIRAALADCQFFGPAAPYPEEVKKAAMLSIATALEADASQGPPGHPRLECAAGCLCGGGHSMCRSVARGIAGHSKGTQQMVTNLEKRVINFLWGLGLGGHDDGRMASSTEKVLPQPPLGLQSQG